MRFHRAAAGLVAFVCMMSAGRAQAPGGPPPSVGVAKAEQTAITETSEFIGRVQAIDRVALTARVTAFLDERLFKEGTEVQQGDLLFRLERAPFEAAAQQQEAAVADTSSRLANANIQLGRAQSLLSTPAGQRSTVDDLVAAQRSQAALVLSAQAQLRAAQINLAYTEIRAPVAGKISRTSITIGNVVSPSSGPLATIVSQDPMYVTFPVASRVQTELQTRYADKGGVNAVVVKLRLPNGSLYGQGGKIDYVEPSVSASTDTVLLRARIANPALRPPGGRAAGGARAGRQRLCHGAGGGRPAGDGAGHPAQGGAVGPAGGLCLCRSRRQQGRAAAHPAWPVDADDRCCRRRPEGRRDGGSRGHPAGQAGDRGQPRAAQPRAGGPRTGREIVA